MEMEHFECVVQRSTDDIDNLWLMKLASRPNYMTIGIPYIPVALKNIESYTKLKDYAVNRVKKIETIGILKPIDRNTALLTSTTPSPRSWIKLAIENLRSDYLYPIDASTVCRGFRNAWNTVKVYGTLETRNDEVVLLVDCLVRIDDIESCEKTLDMMAKFADTNYNMHGFFDPLTDGQLQSYIDRSNGV